MKNLYIPKGKTLHYEALACRNIVNDGVLIVENSIQARHISGKGVLDAGSIACRSLSAADIDAAHITTENLAAERVCASEVRVSGAAVVSCCLEAAYVETPRLTVALSQIGELRAQEVVNLSDRRRSIPGALLAGFFRRLWMSLTVRVPVDAEYVPIEDTPESAPETPEPALGNGDAPDFEAFAPPPGALNADLWDDFEFKRLAALYRLLKPSGYALRLAPFPAGEDIHAVEPGFRDAA